MRKFAAILLLLSLSGCTREDYFDTLEISFTDRHDRYYSFFIDDNGNFRYIDKGYEERSGKLNPQQFQKLEGDIYAIYNGEVKSFDIVGTEAPITSILMKIKGKTVTILQKGQYDIHLVPLLVLIDTIMHGNNAPYEKPIFYSTAKDIIPRPVEIIKLQNEQ